MIARPATVLFLLLLMTGSAFGQFWEETNGPPASTTTLITNQFGWIYAGTASSAIYRSKDRGTTWQRTDEGIDDGGPNFVTVNQIALGATGDILFAAVNDKGIVRSTDYGVTWHLLDIGIEVTGKARMSVSTKTSGGKTEVFVGYDAGAANLLLRYSDDGGDSFTELPKSNLPGAMSSIYETFMSPNSNKMFVLVAYNKGLYRTTDMGGRWTRIDSDPGSGESDDNFLTMRAGPDGRLYIGRNALASSVHSENAVVMRSSNDGESWEYLTDGWDNKSITNNTVTGIAFGANEDVWAITAINSGVFFSSNGGDNWVSMNDGLAGDGSGQGIAVSRNNHVYVAPNGAFIHRHLDPTSSVNEELPRVLRTVTTAPNPARDHVFLNVALESAGRVTVNIISYAGVRVLAPYQQDLSAGDHSLHFNTTNMPSGMYAWTMTAGGEVRTGTFTVIR